MIKRFFLFLLYILPFSFINAQIHYTDVALQSGINHSSQNIGIAGGISFEDFNKDGWDDITIASETDAYIYFYQNNKGNFELLSPLVLHKERAQQILWVDFDNDGDKDLYISTYGGANRLYLQTDHLVFEDITESAHLPINDLNSYGAAFADYNRDGWLDLYYCERVPFQPMKNQFHLFKNNGNLTFTEVTETSNTANLGGLPFCASFFDYNNDNWPDIYIANDKGASNVLYENNKDGTFKDVSFATNTGLTIDAMCVNTGDYNNDGWQDIYVTNTPTGNILLRNNGNTQIFDEIAEQAGVGYYGTSWGSVFLDADHDEDLDLYVSGSTYGDNAVPSAFYENTSNNIFIEPNAGFFGDTGISYSNAIGDFNNDGLSDIVVANKNPSKSNLWKNETNSNQNWLKVKLEGVKSNRDAIGTKLEAYSTSKYQLLYTQCGNSFLGQNSTTQIFGLAENNQLDSLIITWPTGHIDRLYDVDAQQTLQITEGSTTNGIILIEEEVLNPPIPTAVTHFIEYNTEAGIDHVVNHSLFMGGGAAFFDYDNDGDDDLYITSGKDMDHFYVNNGDDTFDDKSVEAGLGSFETIYSMGVIAGDIDNDGFKDLFITTNQDDAGNLAKNILLYNNGDGTFEDIWTHDNADEKVFSIGATFLDYDLDGLLDIYVVNYVETADFLTDNDGNTIGFNHDCYENLFYKNMGNGEFQEIGESIGINDNGCALAVTATDFDMDNDMDIYIANDFGEFIIPNRLYENTDSSFEDISESTASDLPMYGMGIAIGDIDNDLDLDYYVTNFGKNRLITNEENVFEDVTDICGVGDEWVDEVEVNLAVGWGTSFADMDNDKDLDLYVANGYVPSPNFLPSTFFIEDKLYVNEGNMTFTEADSTYGISNRYVARGMTHSDYDNDGDIDYLSVVLNAPVNSPGWKTILYKNELGNEKNWLQITLEGVDVNRDAYGSKVYIHASDETYIRELNGGASHCSHLSSRLHFGLEDITMVDSVTVVWTGGRRTQVEYDFAANQHIHIVEDTTITPIVTANTAILLDKNDFKIFPNPAQQQIVIEYKNEMPIIEFYNTVGQLIPIELDMNNEQFIFANVNNLVDGIYFIKLKIEHKLITKKVIIQRNE